MMDGTLDKDAQEIYGNRVRVRVCGLCWRDERLLLINHGHLYGHDFWSPPGGGVDFGESAETGLKREFTEETGLLVDVGPLLFVCEYIKYPLHAVELFFEVLARDGEILVGKDPEMRQGQTITAVAYKSIPEILQLPESHRHGVFRMAPSANALRALKGYCKI